MNTTSEHFLDFLCRTCMQELVETSSYTANNKQKHQWHWVYDTIEESAPLRIEELLCNTVPQIEFQPNDELPKKICRKCFEQLRSIYKFQQMCVQSQQHIQQLISKITADLKLPIKNPSQNHKVNTKGLAVQAYSSGKTKEQGIEFALVNTLPEATQSTSAADPLQSVNEIKLEIRVDSETDISVYVINEVCTDDDTKVEHSNGETQLSTVAIKNKVVDIETGTEVQQVSLPSSTHICPLCKKSFTQSRLLKTHLKRHKKWDEQKDKPVPKREYFRLKCNTCDRFFYKAESLHKHDCKGDNNQTKRDNNQCTYTCEICNKPLSSRRTLRNHKINHHSESKQALRKFVCEICNKDFLYKANLTLHVRTHTGERPFLCSECGKSFSRARSLHEHRLRHSDVKHFECPNCPSKFHSSSDLHKHKTVHEQNKRHVCDVCDAGFTKAYQLRVHKMYHTGEKNYKCNYCDKGFVGRHSWRRHTRTHTGEKPYKCKYCVRAFAQSNDHIKHLRSHIGENVYRCEMCPSAFRLASELRVHFATHKHEDEETRVRNLKALEDEEAKLQIKIAT